MNPIHPEDQQMIAEYRHNPNTDNYDVYFMGSTQLWTIHEDDAMRITHALRVAYETGRESAIDLVRKGVPLEKISPEIVHPEDFLA